MIAGPSVTVSHSAMTVMEGSGTSLTCHARPHGKSTIKTVNWFKDFEPISPRHQTHSVNNKTHTNTLKLQDLNISESADYNCRVSLVLPFSDSPQFRWFWSAHTKLTVSGEKLMQFFISVTSMGQPHIGGFWEGPGGPVPSGFEKVFKIFDLQLNVF